MNTQRPIGVFDSGVGGLSVLREIRALLPDESLIYYADSGYCPYGGKSQAEIQARSAAITEELMAAGAKLIVVACNTATIAAVESLRATYPLPFVGMEPAVKPAVAATRTGVVGVLATGAALGGNKFHHLLAQHARDVRIITQPCPGLVEHVERGDLDSAALRQRLRGYVQPLLDEGVGFPAGAKAPLGHQLGNAHTVCGRGLARRSVVPRQFGSNGLGQRWLANRRSVASASGIRRF